jgi:hypothetical protein
MSIEDIEQNLDREDRRFEKRAERKEQKKKRGKHGCFRFFLGWLVAIIIIILVASATVVFVVGPIVQKASEIPNDFPKEFALYQADKAKVIMQNPENSQKLISLVGKLPDWVLKPIWGMISNNIEQKLSNAFGDGVTIPEGFSVEEFKDILSSSNLTDAQTVWLSWDGLDKTKEQLAEFYREQLDGKNFEIQENLSDYEIDINFWKEGVFGNLSLTDDQDDSSGNAEIMVNYIQDQE